MEACETAIAGREAGLQDLQDLQVVRVSAVFSLRAAGQFGSAETAFFGFEGE